MKRLSVFVPSLVLVLALGLLACQTAKPPQEAPVPAAPAQAVVVTPGPAPLAPPPAAPPPAAPPAPTPVPVQPPVAAPVPAPAVAPIAAKPLILNPDRSYIETDVAGFSPLAESGKTTIDLDLAFANVSSVKGWKVLVSKDGETQRTFSGGAAKLPASISWDGKTASGKLAPDGRYVATLTVDYGSAYTPGKAQSPSFVLATKKPTGAIAISPSPFAPFGTADTVVLRISPAASQARLESWSMDILDPGGNLFRSFSGKLPDNEAVWDGRGISGDLVASAEDYPVVAKLRDEFGNTGLAKATIPIDILVVPQGTGYRIDNSRLYFKGFTADYHDVPAELYAQNLVRLDRLASMLKKFPDYRIRIVGHAVMIHWDNKALGQAEQDGVLIPLSKARAEAIKQALVERGLEPAIIETEGVGAADPLVPDSDFANRWRNRRTAIFLLK